MDITFKWWNEILIDLYMKIAQKTRKETLIPQLEELGISVIFNSLIILVIACNSSIRSFYIHEDLFLKENLQNCWFDDILIPSKHIHEKILRYKCLKQDS